MTGFAAATVAAPLVTVLGGLLEAWRARRVPVFYAQFEREVCVPAGPLPPHHEVEFRHCPQHGTTAHRITHGGHATCWTCQPEVTP